MTQLTFGQMPVLGIEGTNNNTGTEEVLTKQANEDIEFGRKLSYDDATQYLVSMTGIKKVTLTLAADLSANNVFAFTINAYNTATKVETVTNISRAYAVSHAATMANVVADSKLAVGIDPSTSYTSDVLNLIAAPGYIIKITSETATGTGTADAVTKSNSDTRSVNGEAGISHWKNKQPFVENGVQVSRYISGDPMVDMFIKGNPVIKSPTGFTGSDNLYVVGYGANRGRLVNVIGDSVITDPITSVKHYATASGTDSKGVVIMNLP